MAYQNNRMIREGVKIYKYQNHRSAVDVTHMLNSYREKGEGERKELLYAGRLCFSIYADGKYEKAYVTKSKLKVVLNAVKNGTFRKLFPNGFQDFGGGVEEGKAFSKKLEFRIEKYNNKVKFIVNIEKMPGKKTSTGAFKPTGKAYLRVNTMLDPIDFLELATEVTDFIKAAEISAISKESPMNTLTNLSYEKLERKEKTNETTDNYNLDKDFTKMDSREFYKHYMFIKHYMQKAQEEYDDRVARSNKSAANN